MKKIGPLPAPTADNPVGVVIEEHPNPRPKRMSWPYGKFQIFINGRFVCSLDLQTVVENRQNAYQDLAHLSQAIAEVYNIPAPTIAPAIARKLLDRARKIAQTTINAERDVRIISLLNRDRFAPEGYTERELREDWS